MRAFLLELKLAFADRGAWLLVVALAAALAFGVRNGAAADGAARADAKRMASAEDDWQRQLKSALLRSPLEPRQVAQRPSIAALPPAPFAALAIGQSDLLPAHEQVSVFRIEQPAEARTELENPGRLLAGRFDLAFVLVWLLPLVLLAAASDLCAGDREAGTLRMVLAQGTSPRLWLARRALARGLPALLLAGGAVFVAAVASDGERTAARAWLALLVILAYGLFWLALAALVNGFARSAAAAATAAGSAWVAFVLIVPTLLNLVAESLHPSPSRAELVAESRAAAAATERRGGEVLESFFAEHPELAPPDLQADMLSFRMAVQSEVGKAMAPVKERFAAAALAQQREVERWRFASPAIAAHEALTELAGTGYWRYRHFSERTTEFKDQLLGFFEPRFHRREPVKAADLSQLPRFTFAEEPFADVVSRVTASVAGIVGLAALLTLLALARFSPRRLAA